MTANLYFKEGATKTQIPFIHSMAREDITVTDVSITTYTVTADFTNLLVFLDGVLCRPTTGYTVSGKDVTFLDALPLDSEITFVSFF